MKGKKIFSRILSGVLMAAMVLTLMLPVSAEAKKKPASPAELSRVTVHDPSIYKTTDGEYYVLGSHVASAKSSNLMQWQQISTDYQNVDGEPFYGDLSETFKEPFQWAGYNDGDVAPINGNDRYGVWAPDVIWNPYYQWDDGDTGAYMLYCCTSSTWRRSCIGYLVSKTFDGEYKYVDTVIYSGFTKNGAPDGNSTRDTRWDNDYLNLKELVALGSENGGIDEISDKWFNGDDWNNLYAPNAIDPTVFFDPSGEKLYMTYGSWSGGLFILELDPTTGAVKYPGVDSVDEASGNYVDRYFGTHIAGGNHESGEAPYILYDEETGYYYLYETYGGLTAMGGYNMRMFRSKNVYGPYVDAAGNNAADSNSSCYQYGIKLIANYEFYDQVGKRAAGHNSALIDDDGSRYLVYHQRFNAKPITEYHELRIHQQFLNEDNWPVTAVYEYRGEEISKYRNSEIVGTYQFINHGNAAASGAMEDTIRADFLANGKIAGDVTGTWKKSNSSDGYNYATITIDGVVYKGVFFKQYTEQDDPERVMTFTAIGDNNTCIWGSKINNKKEVAAVAAEFAIKNLPTYVKENIALTDTVMGADITWTSSDPNVLSAEGVVNPQEEDTVVVLTATAKCNGATAKRDCEITVGRLAKLIYGYNFETAAGEDNTLTPDEGSAKTGAASLMGTASIVKDETRGNVLKLTNEAGAKGVNYLKLPEDTLSSVTSDGYSVSMWVNIGAETFEHSALFEADLNANYPMTRIGANLIARINANGYSDVQGDLLTTSGERDQWQQVVYTVNAQGIKVYLNGKLAGEEQKDLSSCFDTANASSIEKAVNVSVGSGFIWGDEDVRNAMFDDVKVYDGILTSKEVQKSYNGEDTPEPPVPPVEEKDFSASCEIGGTTITVEAEAGVIPEGTELKVCTIKKADKNLNQKILKFWKGKTTIFPVKITLIKDGEEIQPDGEMNVSISVSDSLKKKVYTVYGINSRWRVQIMDSSVEEDTITFTTDHTGYYTLVGSSKALKVKENTSIK